MPKTLNIDIVSDVSCPWCVIGYHSLRIALDRLLPDIEANIRWHPFELNPVMPAEGQDVSEHLAQKYGMNDAQLQQSREHIAQRGLQVGYAFGERGGGRIYNTFNAHRLLHWAAEEAKQTPLKLALFDLYFKQRGNPSDAQQLLAVVAAVGLDVNRAAQILDSDEYAQPVRHAQAQYQQLGISAVPAFIINQRHLISGGQPPEVFEQALRELSLSA